MRVRYVCVCCITWTDNEYFGKVDNLSRQQAKCGNVEAWPGNVEVDMGYLHGRNTSGDPPKSVPTRSLWEEWRYLAL